MAEQIIKKRCSKCKQIKLIINFYPRKDRPCGFQSHCKECHKKYFNREAARKAGRKYHHSEKGKKYRRKYQHSEKYRTWLRKYRRTEKHKEYVKKYMKTDNWQKTNNKRRKKYAENHPEKESCHHAVTYAVRVGKIKPARDHKCIKCSKPATQYHHYQGYSKEHKLDVVPVCLHCHKIIHGINGQSIEVSAPSPGLYNLLGNCQLAK